MTRQFARFLLVGAAVFAPGTARGQDGPLIPDSIVVEGNRRNARETILLTTGLSPGRVLSYRDVQLAIQTLFGTGQYSDVRIEERHVGGRTLVAVVVREAPILTAWNLRGVEHVPERTVRDMSRLPDGRPLDEAQVRRSRAAVDSLYRARGYALAQVHVRRRHNEDSSEVTVVLEVEEGRRVAISQVDIDGNTALTDAEIVAAMASRPEGFFWFRSGAYDDEELRQDVAERLPGFYGQRGYIDFQVLDDTIVVDEETGKAVLRVRVSEGESYLVGAFSVVGNRRFSTEEIEALYPFTQEQRTGLFGLGTASGPRYFDQALWQDATNAVRTLYFNNGYVYVQVVPEVTRGRDEQGRPSVDLRWTIEEGQPAVVNRIEIVGNDVTREAVIRDAIVLLPGDVYRQDALIRSYQNVSNLGFFEQPLPPPDTRQANEQGDLDIVFEVTEKRTGNINFGASLGQGTGIGGFIGLDEPNLFGRGKRGRFQWQFGENINDFDLSYTDPVILGTRISGTLGVHNTRLRYTIGDLGQFRRRGATLRIGFPVRDRYSRLYLTYEIDEQSYVASTTNREFAARFGCTDCVRSTIRVSMLRDTRIDLPFATAGAMVDLGVSHSGGILGGRGNFQRVDLEGRWYAPLGELGGDGRGGGVRFVLAYSTRSGFVFGDAPFFQQLFFMGGTQFGTPLRGYNEFAITPGGFDPNARTGQASGPNSFGKAFFSMTAEVGARLSQIFYLSFFHDAGNLWADPASYNPTKLFRGAGIGVSVVSPLGAIGLDYAYGFDKTDQFGRPDPGWTLHFKLGDFF